ncbi:MAG: hypothetical protein K6U74_02220, partial [Firmicutes bacterium]|nr:hypothetical protein [Bacillota bacterium]
MRQEALDEVGVSFGRDTFLCGIPHSVEVPSWPHPDGNDTVSVYLMPNEVVVVYTLIRRRVEVGNDYPCPVAK